MQYFPYVCVNMGEKKRKEHIAPSKGMDSKELNVGVNIFQSPHIQEDKVELRFYNFIGTKLW